jgi:ribonuclease HII
VLEYESKYKKLGYDRIIGIDEAGRGPLAGPVVAGAVWLKNTEFTHRIDDSKKLSPRQREAAYPEILANAVVGIGLVREETIDAINILQATTVAMERALQRLVDRIQPQEKLCVFVDGTVRIKTVYPYVNIIHGDAKSLSIACASIVAKVVRDRIMAGFDRLYPQYGFVQHKGYGTALHRKRIVEFGISAIHRRSFSGV